MEAGDGTTSVVVLAGSLLDASQKLLAKGLNKNIRDTASFLWVNSEND